MKGRPVAAVAVLLTASFTLSIDFSILNVALPVIGADVGFALPDLQWIATSFALCAAGFTLLSGRIADLFGRRRVFLLGIALLGVSSLAGGLAQTPSVLLTARFAQGLATAIVTPAALSLLTTAFSESSMRERVLGWNGALMAAGFTTGAVLGGLLTDLVSWRWAFFVNVFVAVAVLAVGPVVLAAGAAAARPKLDVLGSVTVTAGLLAVVYGLTRPSLSSGWVPLLAGVVLLAGFWWLEQRVASPLVRVSVLRRRTVAWGNLAVLLAFATETSLVFVLTLYLQDVLGMPAFATGLSFAVLGLGTVLGGLAGPRVIRRLGSARAIVAGLVLQAAATLPLVALTENRAWLAVVLPLTFAGGVGNLIAIVSGVVTATSAVPADEQGVATGLVTLSQQIGITLGIPVMSAVVATRALLPGITTAILLNAGLALATATALAMTRMTSRQHQV